MPATEYRAAYLGNGYANGYARPRNQRDGHVRTVVWNSVPLLGALILAIALLSLSGHTVLEGYECTDVRTIASRSAVSGVAVGIGPLSTYSGCYVLHSSFCMSCLCACPFLEGHVRDTTSEHGRAGQTGVPHRNVGSCMDALPICVSGMRSIYCEIQVTTSW